MAKTGKKKPKVTERPTISEGDFSHASNGESGNRVFVSIARTVNIGNYESIRAEYGVGRTVTDGHPFSSTLKACNEDALKSLGAMVKVIKDNT